MRQALRARACPLNRLRGRRRARHLLPLAVTFLLGATPVAAAGEQVASSSYPLLGPVLSGHGLAWIDRPHGSVSDLAYVGRDDDDVIRTPLPGDPSSQDLVALVASGDRVALVDDFGNHDELLTGSVGGRLRVVSRDAFGSGLQYRAALTGTTLVQSLDPNPISPLDQWQVVTRDLKSGARVVIGRGDNADTPIVEAAGKLVAWSSIEGSPVVVYDLRRRRVVRTVDIGRLGLRGQYFSWRLQADGKLAILYDLQPAQSGIGQIGRLAWLGAQGTLAHRLYKQAYITYDFTPVDLQMARDRIAFLRPARGGSQILTLVDLRGRARPVVRFTARYTMAGQIDFDGHRMAWAAQRVDRVVRAPCPPPPTIGPAPGLPFSPHDARTGPADHIAPPGKGHVSCPVAFIGPVFIIARLVPR